LPDPEINVVWPTVTPATSVMALKGPGVPSNGTPKSLARGTADAPAADAAHIAAMTGIAYRKQLESHTVRAP
jgi:hypothetical protein